jgi:hypothetical protein
MAFLQLFERVIRHVESQGVQVTFQRGHAVSRTWIADACRALPVPLPEQLSEFYAELGDGVTFQWVSENPDPVPPTAEQAEYAAEHAAMFGEPPESGPSVFSSFEFPSLADLVAMREYRESYAVEFERDYLFPHVRDRELAVTTARAMRLWIGLIEIGNGDRICLDTSVEPAPVVFDRHAWFDGDGSNGQMLGRSLLDFMTRWADVCFMVPSSMWWPSVFANGGVDWASQHFDRQFCLPGTGA